MISITGTGEDVIHRHLDLRFGESTDVSSFVTESLLHRCSSWIITNECQNVGLQFPDALLSKTAAFYSALKRLLPENVSLYVLADSSFTPCCADVVTAEHTNCDSLIHFGHACLTQLESAACLITLNVPVSPEIDISNLVTQLQAVYRQDDIPEVLVLYDVVFSERVDEIVRQTASVLGSRQLVSRLLMQTEEQGESQRQSLSETHTELKYGRLVPRGAQLETGRFDVLYISATGRSKARLLFELALWKRVHRFLVYEADTKKLRVRTRVQPVEKTDTSNTDEVQRPTAVVYEQFDEAVSFLKRRFVVMQRLREARTVGLLVGSLHVAGATPLLDELRQRVRRSGRRAYTFAVGRLNIPKLANYLEVDTFCLVSCVESSLFDDAAFVREFHAPLCSPFELLLALEAPSAESIAALLFEEQCQADLFYSTQLRDLLAGSRLREALGLTFGGVQTQEAELSLVSGTLQRVTNVDAAATGTQQPAYAREHDRRTYFGMPEDASADVDELGEAVDQLGVLEGRSGIASRYTDDVLTLSRATTRITTPRSGSARSSFSEN